MVTGENATSHSNFTEEVEHLIHIILPCYLDSAQCPPFQAASAPLTNLPNYTLPMYVNVIRSENYITSLTGLLFTFLTGDKFKNLNASECHRKHLSWVSNFDSKGLCINTTLIYSDAVSPAFIIDGNFFFIYIFLVKIFFFT